MSCDLTRSRGRQCKDVLGGNSYIYPYDYLVDSFTVVAGEGTAMNVALTDAFSYLLEGDANTLEQVMDSTTNRVNTQTLSIQLSKMTAADNAEFNLLAASRAPVVVKDKAGNYHALGITEGMVWNITSTTGGAKGDVPGYTITATAQESELAPILDSATVTAFLAVVTAP